MTNSSDAAPLPQPSAQANTDTRPRVSRKRRRKGDKPSKPYADFPLFPHATRRWAKKIRGKLHYFGPWADPDGALAKYLEQRDDLHAGRKPVDTSTVMTIEKLVNKFLTWKRGLVDSGELTPRSFAEYHATCQRVIDAFGWNRDVDNLRSDDFEKLRGTIAKKWGPHRLSGEIQRTRSLFKYAEDAGHTEKKIRFGPGFKKPSKQRMRQHRASSAKKLFTREEIKSLLDAAGTQMRAMILLGINGGLGNNDCAMLPQTALDLERGWLDFPRPKNGIDRRIPLWAETVAAIKEALAKRPVPKEPEAEGKVFVTKYGKCWAKHGKLTTKEDGTPTARSDSPVTQEMRKLLNALHINGRRGLGFYSLRHTHETIGGGCRDQVAVDAIMGHVDPSMSAQYREHIDDDRLRAVTNHVHDWLFPTKVQSEQRDRAG